LAVSVGGDERTGWRAEKQFASEQFDQIPGWLIEAAMREYPKSGAGSSGKSFGYSGANRNVTRRYIAICKGQRSQNFPAPVAHVTSDTSLYDWSQDASWPYHQKNLSCDQAIEATAVKVANEAIGAGGETARNAPGPP